jgi:hypothetical protein
LPRPRLRAYRPETVVAEKLHTMVALGAINSRMRDFFDVHALATRESFDGDDKFARHLVQAVRNGLGDRAGTCVDPGMQVVQGKTVVRAPSPPPARPPAPRATDAATVYAIVPALRSASSVARS